ncbi:YlxR family protein [uncultured Corynebacterium sp.]|uniref:YlxR family protein n=1 Tax=uncultured Corynebacterium sp. TaxID=159447 RepID=UPI0025EC02E4|nr:YlxR family protein [uncultured Corynebacterium sp.]
MIASKSHVPQRTCIATRKVLPISQLLRVVVVADSEMVKIMPDPRHRMGGRGAWIQPTVEAFEVAHTRRAFARALKVSKAKAIDVDPVRTYIEGLPPHVADS